MKKIISKIPIIGKLTVKVIQRVKMPSVYTEGIFYVRLPEIYYVRFSFFLRILQSIQKSPAAQRSTKTSRRPKKMYAIW